MNWKNLLSIYFLICGVSPISFSQNLDSLTTVANELTLSKEKIDLIYY